MTAWWDFNDFSGLVGDPFVVVVPEGDEVTLVLTDASLGAQPGGTSPDGTARQQFSLVFTGPPAPTLGQGTRELTHATLGTLALFLVPVGGGRDGLRYEAAFA